MVRSVADRAFLPTKNLLEEVGDMMILTGKTVLSALRFAVLVCVEVVLVPASRVDGGVWVWGAGVAGGEFLGVVRGA
jgi:hypothetical protein